MPGFKPEAVFIKYVDTEQALIDLCGYKTLACTQRNAGLKTAFIYMGPNADNCILRHEFKHAAGWNHDDRDVYRKDCG